MLPGYPHHILQRGHNGQAVFTSPRDFTYYLNELADLKEAFNISLYAYCLMPNHVHLLVCPQHSASSLAAFMKALSARATRYRNRVEKRSGTLWGSRYKSSLVQQDHYLLASCLYIDLNPVLGRLVAFAEDYPWSSVRERLGMVESRHLDWCSAFDALGNTGAERVRRYTHALREPVCEYQSAFIRGSLQRGQLTGTRGFVDEIEHVAGVRLEQRGRGRPRKGIALR